MSGYIYKITCLANNKIYIGQATEFKYKNDIQYNYGLSGRWSDHVSSSKKSTKPLHKAICEYGKEMFTIEELEKASSDTLDTLEAKYIDEYNSVIPNGYNVASHSRNRHHSNDKFYELYLHKVNKATIRPIRKNGEYKIVYVMLYLKDGTTERLAFGQNKDYTYEVAFKEAKEFVENLNCPYEEETHNSNILNEKYKSKLELFIDKEITKVRITTASSLIAVYVYENKKHTRICFGGKTITKDSAYETAKQFVNLLNVSNDLIDDNYQSPQQVAA